MGEPYATYTDPNTGKKEYYMTKKDYQAGRAKKSASRARQIRRVLGSGR